MATTKKDAENIVVGVDTAPNPVKAEEDFLTGLLAAADFTTEEDNLREMEIVRNGTKLFSFTIRPITQDEFYAARKKGAKYVKNPINKKLPLIEDEGGFSTTKFHSWLIYTATIEKDREKVWNNAHLKEKLGALQPVDCIPGVLKMGEISKIVDEIMTISGIGEDDETSVEDTVKN